jgi:hypothetical protein
MKTFDFTILPQRPPVGEPKADAAGDVENGWEAYASWLRKVREHASERHALVPPDLIP